MLTIVATPIGNLSDLSPRALEALKKADGILCEDTRRTLNLVRHFGFEAKLARYQDDKEHVVRKALERLQDGENLALVSDGGMPVLSDPGRGLVAAAREAGVPVTVIPGPDAVSTALAGSGLPAGSYVFLGFLPRSRGKKRKALAAAKGLGTTVVVYESPYRVVELLKLGVEVFGPEAQAVVARELTKMHEEWTRGTTASVLADYEKRDKVLGECVVLLHPRQLP